MDWITDSMLTAAVGFGGGALLGLAARRGRFCTLGAIEDALYMGDYRRIRMWALALSLAIAGVFCLSEFGLVDRDGSIYATIGWNPFASAFGGLVFGYGMAIAGNCGYGALARLGGGDLRSFVIVLVIGISAFMAIGGPFGVLREAIFPTIVDETATAQGFADTAGAALGSGPLIPALLVALLLAGWALSAQEFRRSAQHVIWSAVAGAAIVSGWVGTTLIASESFDVIRVESHSYTTPLGETILYLMTASGGGIGFGVGSVAGVLAGAFVGSISKGHFRWEACDDARELGRQILGAFLMGVGGVVALGCSIGQGLTAFSTLAYSAPVVLAFIFIGASIGLRQLIRGLGAAG